MPNIMNLIKTNKSSGLHNLQLIRNKKCPWGSCILPDQDEKRNGCRGW